MPYLWQHLHHHAHVGHQLPICLPHHLHCIFLPDRRLAEPHRLLGCCLLLWPLSYLLRCLLRLLHCRLLLHWRASVCIGLRSSRVSGPP